MLTGRPPYQGRDFLDTIVQVRTLEIVSPRRLVPNLPRDLETICLKCLAKQPHRRYVSAQALAEDLRRFLHGEPIVARPVGRTERLWRWCQRNPLVASLSAALGLLLFAGLLAGWWLAVWALEEKQRADELAEAATARAREAEANFQLAKQAVDDCYLMARDNPLFQQEANWQARRLLLEKALPFYENFRFQRANDPEILATLADNYRKIGFILHELGRKKEALHAYAQARAVLLRLEELRPQPDQVFGLVQIWQACGNLHREMGERKEAGEAFATAQQLLERLQQNTPTDARYAFELAAVQHNQGLLALDAGQYKEALNTFVHVQQLLRQLPSKGTPLAQRKRLLAATLMHLGTLHRQQRQLVTAQEEVLEAKRLWQELVTAYPQATSYEAELGMACNNLGNVYQDQKKITRAVPEYLQAKAIHEKLLARLPVTVDRQRDLAMTCSNLALAFKDLGRHEEAREHFQQALRTWERLHKEHPETAYYPFALAATHNNLGLLQHRLGEESDAEQSYRLAITLGEKVRTKQPHNGEVASQLALWYCNLARQHLDLKNFPDALQEYDRAQELYGWLAQRNAHVPLFTVQQCQALLAKGHLHRLLQEEAEAFRCYGDIIRRLGVLLARKETAANLERTWQQACIAQAELHLLHGSYQEALQDLLRLKMPR
jgi:tetratricopeptide (TPR) repeat protein